jgi:hypothetical protein
VLRFLIGRWKEASVSERDPTEHEAFAVPINILSAAMDRANATHDDIRKAIPVCPAYPNFGKQTLMDLADAERDGRSVTVTERSDGALKWEFDPPK